MFSFFSCNFTMQVLPCDIHHRINRLVCSTMAIFAGFTSYVVTVMKAMSLASLLPHLVPPFNVMFSFFSCNFTMQVFPCDIHHRINRLICSTMAIFAGFTSYVVSVMKALSITYITGKIGSLCCVSTR